MRRLVTPLAVAVMAALAASLAWGFRLKLELVRERLAAAAQREALERVEARLAASEQARRVAESSLQSQTELNIRRMFPESRSAADSAALDRFNAAADRDPLWQSYFRQWERRRVLARYGIAIDALKIPAAKRKPLEDLLVERAIAMRMAVHKLREQDRSFNSPEVLAAFRRAADDADLKIRELVGDKAAQELKEWNSAIYFYSNVPDGPVAQDAETLREAGYVLSPDQLVKMALIRYETFVLSPDARTGSGAEEVDPATGLTRLDGELLARQAEVLTPAEIAVLRAWTVEERKAGHEAQALRERFHLNATQASSPASARR